MDAHDLARLKVARPLIEIVRRHAAGERRIGGRSFWLCPFHNEKTPSFTLTPDGGRYICFGCGAGGDVLDFVMRVEGLSFAEAVAFLSGSPTTPRPAKAAPARPASARSVEPCAVALKLWREARPAEGTPIEAYLRRRGLTLPIPASIRHHPGLLYTPAGLRFPAMVCAVQAPDRRLQAIHRTYLTADGRKADVASPKMMLGPCAGGAVRLGPAARRLLVGEGIETSLAAMQATGIPAWAALSTSGLRSLILPSVVREVVIAADGDGPGIEAAEAAARRWTAEGRTCRIARPPEGSDFADVLVGRTAEAAKACDA